jgi:hypothetical protein
MAIDKSEESTRTLVRYWTRGDGAAKIRWGVDGSFGRCTRALAGKVRDPDGLCAELHKEATGEWPAEKGVESAAEPTVFDISDEEWAGLAQLNAAMNAAGGIRFRGLIAPIEKPTGDRRMFAESSLSFRTLPRPGNFQVLTSSGHAQSVTVAKLERTYLREDGWWGEGRFLDPRMVPEVPRAIYLLKEKVVGPSVDVSDVTYEIVPHPDFAGQTVVRFTKGKVMGFTLVAFPAFAEVEIMVDDFDSYDALTAAGIPIEFAVNANSWKRMPLGPRDQSWNADDAIGRLIEWSGGQPTKFRTAFLYINDKGEPTSRDSYRLPIADVVDGRLVLMPHAVYAAAALLSGAHGGLPNIEDAEKDRLRDIITEIYSVFQESWSDPRVKPPWLRGGRDQHGEPISTEKAEASAGTGGWCAPSDFIYQADPADAAWIDLPLVTITRGGIKPPQEEHMEWLAAAAAPVKPPAAWFSDPKLSGPTPLTVDQDGRVYGHLAAWNVCHTGIGNRCIMAPRTAAGYKHFKVGSLMLDSGEIIPIGKITLGGGHADPQLGYIPAAEHYDNSCSAAAVVTCGEDKHGIWVAGATVAGLSEERIAELRRSPLSGDWRRINGNLELVAALAVNAPGYPVLRASAEDLEIDETLLAAGIVVADTDGQERTADGPVREELSALNRIGRLVELDKALQEIARRDKRIRVQSLLGEEK